MPTLVLSHRYSNDSNALFRAALAEGWDLVRLMRFECPESLAEQDPVFYGETLLADAVMVPLGIALLQPTDDWLPRLPYDYRRREVELSTLGVARALTTPRFVKAPDEKWFPARVYADGSALDPGLEDDLPVLVAEPVRFELEFRFFVVERRVATFSVYIRGGEIASRGDEWPAEPGEVEEAMEFVGSLLGDEKVALPPAVVVDVGRIEGRGYAVVEANAAWASGLCGADPREVLRVLRRASVPRGALTEEDRPWARAMLWCELGR